MIGLFEVLMALGAISPVLVLWIAVTVFAAVRLGRGGGRAERFLLAGGIVSLAASLLTVPWTFIIPWLAAKAGEPYGIVQMNIIHAAGGIIIKIIGMAGIICLIYAFWVKFKERNSGAAPQPAP